MNILLTRSKKDSLILKKIFDKYSIKSFIFPVLKIKKLNPKLNKNYQIVIFISKNSVDCGVSYLKKLTNYKILAVGPATANKLKEYGFKVDYYPKKKPSSAALLAIDSVASIKHSNILIFRGVGGVEILKDGFDNSNNIDYLEVYERVIVQKTEQDNKNIINFLKNKNKIIIISSCYILQGLLELVDNLDRHICLMVISERVKNYAINFGFDCIIVASNIDDKVVKKIFKTIY